MQAETEIPIQTTNKSRPSQAFTRTWQEFTDRAMDLLFQNPTTSTFIIKYVPKTHKFVLRVTDGTRLVMRKCNTEELAEVQKFTKLAGRAFTNEGNRKNMEQKKGEDDKGKKESKEQKEKMITLRKQPTSVDVLVIKCITEIISQFEGAEQVANVPQAALGKLFLSFNHLHWILRALTLLGTLHLSLLLPLQHQSLLQRIGRRLIILVLDLLPLVQDSKSIVCIRNTALLEIKSAHGDGVVQSLLLKDQQSRRLDWYLFITGRTVPPESCSMMLIDSIMPSFMRLESLRAISNFPLASVLSPTPASYSSLSCSSTLRLSSSIIYQKRPQCSSTLTFSS